MLVRLWLFESVQLFDDYFMFALLQNNLAYVAASHLDGPTYQIICQSKIPITAILSVVILGKILTRAQWVSLASLTLGVGLVHLSGSESTPVSACLIVS